MIFTKLPLELRLQVYRDLHTNDHSNLARTCRQIYLKVIFCFDKVFELCFRTLAAFLVYINACTLSRFSHPHDVTVNYYGFASTSVHLTDYTLIVSGRLTLLALPT